TRRSSAMVMTSPTRTARLAASMRAPLTRTWPEPASSAAAERVRTTRACHSHLSMRWRSMRLALAHVLIGEPVSTFPEHALTPLLGIRLQLLLEGRELGEWRVRIRLLVAAFLRRGSNLGKWLAAFFWALRAVGALGTIGTLAPLRPLAALAPVGSARP